MPNEIIQMKISLDDIKPEIWRRFIINSSCSLDKFHIILQTIMGWQNCHLYGFIVNGEEYMPSDDDDEFFESDALNTKGMTIKKLKLNEKDKIKYIYDYGDNWEHTIKIEKIINTDDKIQTPLCVDGERNCPPEDCGSYPGYDDIVNAMKKPKSKEAKEFIEWLGEPYDSEKFDIERINAYFEPVKRKTHKKAGAKKIGPNKIA
jgi:hypothetical protein